VWSQEQMRRIGDEEREEIIYVWESEHLSALAATEARMRREALAEVAQLRDALKTVVDGNDIAASRNESVRSWPDSYARRVAIRALDAARDAAPAPQPAVDAEGEHCQRCGRPYLTAWLAPDDLWGAVTGRTDGGGLYCPMCFTALARVRGVELMWTVRRMSTEPPASEPAGEARLTLRLRDFAEEAAIWIGRSTYNDALAERLRCAVEEWDAARKGGGA